MIKIYSTPFEFFLIAVYPNTQKDTVIDSLSINYIFNIFIYFLSKLSAFGMNIANGVILKIKPFGIHGNASFSMPFLSGVNQSVGSFCKNEAEVASYNKLYNYEI